MINYGMEKIDVQKQENVIQGKEKWIFLINRMYTAKISR